MLEQWFIAIAAEMKKLKPPVAATKRAEPITGYGVEHPTRLKMGSIVKMLDEAGASIFHMDFQKTATESVARPLKGIIFSP